MTSRGNHWPKDLTTILCVKFLSRLFLSEAILRKSSLAVWHRFTLQRPLYCLILKSWLIRPRIISFPSINLRAWKWKRSQAQVQMRFGPILTVCCETHFPAWAKDSKKHKRIREGKPSGIDYGRIWLVLSMINMLATIQKDVPFSVILIVWHCRKPEII